jgi:hypothetical protein
MYDPATGLLSTIFRGQHCTLLTLCCSLITVPHRWDLLMDGPQIFLRFRFQDFVFVPSTLWSPLQLPTLRNHFSFLNLFLWRSGDKVASPGWIGWLSMICAVGWALRLQSRSDRMSLGIVFFGCQPVKARTRWCAIPIGRLIPGDPQCRQPNMPLGPFPCA